MEISCPAPHLRNCFLYKLFNGYIQNLCNFFKFPYSRFYFIVFVGRTPFANTPSRNTCYFFKVINRYPFLFRNSTDIFINQLHTSLIAWYNQIVTIDPSHLRWGKQRINFNKSYVLTLETERRYLRLIISLDINTLCGIISAVCAVICVLQNRKNSFCGTYFVFQVERSPTLGLLLLQ